MIDYFVMDVLIGNDYLFSINEDNLTMSVSIEDENMVQSKDGHNQLLYYLKKIASFPLGDNLFNFLSIRYEDLELIRRAAEIADWDDKQPQGETSSFIASLDCIYLYLLFYSVNRKHLGLEHRSRLDRLSREFEFALNFCCNDEYEPEFKNLTCLQRYHLYCQLYVDNIYTIDRYFTQSRYLFLESSTNLKTLNEIPRMNIKSYYNDYAPSEFEPIVQKPNLPDNVIESLLNTQVSLSFRFRYSALEEYLWEELFSLIKLNVRIKKCNNCGKYFILKGDYATDYCDRIPEGEKNTCKRIAAIKTRKDKVKTNPILLEFQKAYKRNYARQSNKKITPAEFENWVNETTIERNNTIEKYEKNPDEQIVIDFKKYLGNK